MKKNRKLLVVLAALLVVSVIPVAVFAASDTFNDDDGSIFEADIEWLAGAGVTAGCNPPDNDSFCPDAGVTRGQMAAFMRRFAQYLGAEDGTVSNADNAGQLGGMNRYQFQPALFGFDNGSAVVAGNGVYEAASASVTTSGPLVCVIGTFSQADILVRASGYTSGVGTGESATFEITANGSGIGETTRSLEENDGSFAMEWLYTSGGGTDTFALRASEGSGDSYTLANAQITVEVIQDTRCEGFIIVLPSAPNAYPTPDQLAGQ
ncbi:hypothetical protein MNBD_ACTINO02-1638 [hydrothermal vent metagenome]|uniref:SLH domain-containing protein n=1 Tax=hydrothermal vent metagenome TaxID=652676 RepID=A0A3B0TC54_9ZZZZ